MAFAGADVVVHLAFIVTGAGSSETMRSVNVDGTLNALRVRPRPVPGGSSSPRRRRPTGSIRTTRSASPRPGHAVLVPLDRFLYAGRRRPAARTLLLEESAALPEVDLYLLRPPIVLGPHAVGAKAALPDAVGRLARTWPGPRSSERRRPCPWSCRPPESARRGRRGAGPGALHRGRGTARCLQHRRTARWAGTTWRVPSAWSRCRSRSRWRSAGSGPAGLPRPGFLPPAAGWVAALSHPVMVDTTKAKALLGWEPRFTGLEALHATVGEASG